MHLKLNLQTDRQTVYFINPFWGSAGEIDKTSCVGWESNPGQLPTANGIFKNRYYTVERLYNERLSKGKT